MPQSNNLMDPVDTREILSEIAELLESGHDTAAPIVRAALSGLEKDFDQFLVSNGLWGGAGSVADQSFERDKDGVKFSRIC